MRYPPVQPSPLKDSIYVFVLNNDSVSVRDVVEVFGVDFPLAQLLLEDLVTEERLLAQHSSVEIVYVPS